MLGSVLSFYRWENRGPEEEGTYTSLMAGRAGRGCGVGLKAGILELG